MRPRERVGVGQVKREGGEHRQESSSWLGSENAWVCGRVWAEEKEGLQGSVEFILWSASTAPLEGLSLLSQRGRARLDLCHFS